MAQAVHAAFQFSISWPSVTMPWFANSNFLVIVSVPDEAALAALAESAWLLGIRRGITREPDLGNEMTAVSLAPGDAARRLCANLPLALREHVPL